MSIRFPKTDSKAANAATSIAALLASTPEWEASTLESIADILARHGYTHPGNCTDHEQKVYSALAHVLGVV